MQHWLQVEETVLCVIVKNKVEEKRTDDLKTTDSLWPMLSAKPRFPSLMACVPVIKD